MQNVIHKSALRPCIRWQCRKRLFRTFETCCCMDPLKEKSIATMKMLSEDAMDDASLGCNACALHQIIYHDTMQLTRAEVYLHKSGESHKKRHFVSFYS